MTLSAWQAAHFPRMALSVADERSEPKGRARHAASVGSSGGASATLTTVRMRSARPNDTVPRSSYAGRSARPSAARAWLLGAIVLSGCYLSHGRGETPPERMDGGAQRDAGLPRDAGTSRDAGGRDTGRPDGGRRDAGDASIPIPPSVPDAGFEPGTIPFEYFDFCLRYNAIWCLAQDRCCPIPERRFPDVASCHDAFSVMVCAELAASMSWLEGRSTWHGDREERVLDALWDSASRCAAPDEDPDRWVLTGDIPRGGDCTPPALDWRHLQWVDFTCTPGLRCAVTGTREAFSGTCTDPGTAGDPCATFGGCDAAHHCEPPFPSPDLGTCQPSRARGEPCARDWECLSRYCPDGADRCAPSRPSWCPFYD